MFFGYPLYFFESRTICSSLQARLSVLTCGEVAAGLPPCLGVKAYTCEGDGLGISTYEVYRVRGRFVEKARFVPELATANSDEFGFGLRRRCDFVTCALSVFASIVHAERRISSHVFLSRTFYSTKLRSLMYPNLGKVCRTAYNHVQRL